MKNTYLIGALCALALGLAAPANACEAHKNTQTDGTAAMPAHAGQPVVLGDLTLSGAFARATPPRAPVGGGFVTIANTGAGDLLVSARADDIAARVEFHEMTMQGDVMQMRQLLDGLPVPAGATVEMKPGGLHMMFMDLKKPLVEGEVIDVTLVFEQAGEVALPLTVGAINARAAADQQKGADHAGH